MHKRQRKPKGQPRIDNQGTQATLGMKPNEIKQNKTKNTIANLKDEQHGSR